MPIFNYDFYPEHHYHCVICGTKLREVNLGFIACPACDKMFLPTESEDGGYLSLKWVKSIEPEGYIVKQPSEKGEVDTEAME